MDRESGGLPIENPEPAGLEIQQCVNRNTERPPFLTRPTRSQYGFIHLVSGEDELIVLERIFYRVHPVVLPKRLDCLAGLHKAPPGLAG